MHTSARLAGLAGSASLLLALAGCGATASNDNSSGSSGASGSTLNVSAKNFAFNPTALSVPAGATVTVDFSNQDSTEHSFTLDNGGGEADAEGGSSKSFSFTAPQSGTVSFHCKYHPTKMKGTITVGGSGGAGAGGAGSTSAGGSSSSGGYGY